MNKAKSIPSADCFTSSWNATSIVTPVPPSTLTGPIVVKVGGQASSGIIFPVTPKINNRSPAEGVIETSITTSGASFGSTQGSSTITFNGTTGAPTSWSNKFVAPVRAGASTGCVIVSVGSSPSNGITFTVVSAGGISRRTTAADGTTPITGASVKAFHGGFISLSEPMRGNRRRPPTAQPRPPTAEPRRLPTAVETIRPG